jgi:hypothetical protein
LFSAIDFQFSVLRTGIEKLGRLKFAVHRPGRVSAARVAES